MGLISEKWHKEEDVNLREPEKDEFEDLRDFGVSRKQCSGGAFEKEK